MLFNFIINWIFFLMFRFHLNYRFIYYSSGIEFKSRSFWSGIVQHLVAWNLLYWFGCSYIQQLYTSICWVVIKLERLLVSIVVATILVNLTIHKMLSKFFEAALSDIALLLYYKLELYSLKFSPLNLNQLSWKRQVNSAFSTFVIK